MISVQLSLEVITGTGIMSAAYGNGGAGVLTVGADDGGASTVVTGVKGMFWPKTGTAVRSTRVTEAMKDMRSGCEEASARVE